MAQDNSKNDKFVEDLLDILESSPDELAKRKREYGFIEESGLKPGETFFDNTIIYYMYVQWLRSKWVTVEPVPRRSFFRMFSRFFKPKSKALTRGYLLDENTFNPSLEDYFNARVMLRKENVKTKENRQK